MLQARGGRDPEGPCQGPLPRPPEPFPAPAFQNRFVYNGTLKDSHNYQNARFGSSIVWVRDLNQDSYNDVVVGAPLEDNHEGAIYIFHGFRGGLLKTPKQVEPIWGAGPSSPSGSCAAIGSGLSPGSSSREGSHLLPLLALCPNCETGTFFFGDFHITPVGTSPCLTPSQQPQQSPRDPSLTPSTRVHAPDHSGELLSGLALLQKCFRLVTLLSALKRDPFQVPSLQGRFLCLMLLVRQSNRPRLRY